MRYEGQYLGAPEDEFSFWETHDRTDFDPERNLILAMLRRAISDALGVKIISEDFNQQFYIGNVAHEARQWFRDREFAPCGWGWVASSLKLTNKTARAIEEYALGDNQDHWRLAINRFEYATG